MPAQNTLTKTQQTGIAFIRIITGGLLAYHGWEVFNASLMNEYAQWEIFKNMPFGKTMVYAGKAAELIGGLLLAFGLFTRLGTLIIIVTLSYIAFFVGSGKIWYQDQHPFLFVLLAFLFLILGPGHYSLDKLRSKRKRS